MAEGAWTIQRALDWTEGYLERKGDASPRASAQWLLSEALGVSRVQLYVSFDKVLSDQELAVLHDYVARRGAGEPLQYITGEAPFRHITVHVKPGVLIPRPETEVLVSEALALVPEPKRRTYDDDIVAALAKHADTALDIIDSDSSSGAFKGVFEQARAQADAEDGAHAPILVADICTGTGCIALSIASENDDARVIATDLSAEACALARENRKALGLESRVAVLQCDLGAGIGEDRMGTFDLVVSNPPYVPSDVMRQLPAEVADFEPALALDGGADGLAVYRRLLPWARRALKPGGGLAVELHETCLGEAARMASEEGFDQIRIVKDLAGKPRVLVCRRASASEEEASDHKFEQTKR